MGRVVPLAIRFFAKVDRNGPVPAHNPALGQCWLWRGSRVGKGYGQLTIGSRSDGSRRAIQAHRAAFFLSDGIWPEPCCLHHCDNPPCVRRSHLYAGTLSDNQLDVQERGYRRETRGEDHPSARLTVSDVLAIRACACSNSQAARDFGVSEKTIRKIRARISWGHV